MTHCHILSVVSFITAPTAVVGGAEDPTDVDIVGRLGTSELHDISRRRSKRYFIMYYSRTQQRILIPNHQTKH